MTSKYDCKRCGGEGLVECEHCGSLDVICRACDGTGFNKAVFDYESYNRTITDMWKKHGGSSWQLTENGIVIGDAGGRVAGTPEWTVLYADYEKGETKTEGVSGEHKL